MTKTVYEQYEQVVIHLHCLSKTQKQSEIGSDKRNPCLDSGHYSRLHRPHHRFHHRHLHQMNRYLLPIYLKTENSIIISLFLFSVH